MSNKIKCTGCSISIPDVPEDADKDALLCDSCLKLKEVNDARRDNLWGEYEEYPVSDWQEEVANDDTRRGYWSWVEAKVESDE